jgi:hypothetical protein
VSKPKKPAKRETGRQRVGSMILNVAAKEARASSALDGETRSGCPTCGACSPPMTAAEREFIEASMAQMPRDLARLMSATVALRAERSGR